MTRRGHSKEILSTHDAARVCSVTPMTVIRWIQSGQLPAFCTLGGHRRIVRADLVRFCESRGFPLENGKVGRVLVIAADDAMRERVADAVRSVHEGIAVELAADAFRAGQLLVTFRPQLALLDRMLPGCDAFELCVSRLRARLPDWSLVMEGPPNVDKIAGALKCGARRL